MMLERTGPLVPAGWSLEYLYVGTDDLEGDVDRYRREQGARSLWQFQGHGTQIVALRVAADEPVHLLAEHRRPGTVLPVFQVPDLEAAVDGLQGHGWTVKGRISGMPPGTCQLVESPNGEGFALFSEYRPWGDVEPTPP